MPATHHVDLLVKYVLLRHMTRSYHQLNGKLQTYGFLSQPSVVCIQIAPLLPSKKVVFTNQGLIDAVDLWEKCMHGTPRALQIWGACSLVLVNSMEIFMHGVSLKLNMEDIFLECPIPDQNQPTSVRLYENELMIDEDWDGDC